MVKWEFRCTFVTVNNNSDAIAVPFVDARIEVHGIYDSYRYCTAVHVYLIHLRASRGYRLRLVRSWHDTLRLTDK